MERNSLNNFKLNTKKRCLIATPVNHLPSVKEFLIKKKNLFLIEERISKDNLVNKFNEDHTLKYLFVNPNAQGYFIDKEMLSKLTILGINTCSTGTNHIDMEYCKEKKIDVISLKNDFEIINNLPSTSELAFCLMQSLFRKLILCNNHVVDAGGWDYLNVMGNQLAGKTIGCLGFGRLGKIFCNQLRGFNVDIKVCEKENTIIPKPFKKVSINELFLTCDAVAIHVHSSSENKNLVNCKLLEKTKKGFLLVNTSRGDICDELEIAKLINNGHIGGYATDVLSTEFIDIKLSPIYKLAKERNHNIIITPHVGGMTFEGQSKAFLHALNKFKI